MVPKTPGKHQTRQDAGNATRFVTRHGHNVRFCHQWGKWLIYKDGAWTIDDTAEIIRLAEDTVRSIYMEAGETQDSKARKALGSWALRSETQSRTQGMLYFMKARQGIPVIPDQLDTNPFLFNVANGTIDLKTQLLGEHQRADLITKRSRITYDPQAEAPQWTAFLERIIPSPQVRRYLQKAIGYSLTGSTAEQVMFFLYGTGANGKSTFIDVVRSLLGDYGSTTPTSTLTAKVGGEGIPNDLARLKGVRFVSAVETDDGRRLAESVLKQLTGDKKIAARFMRGEWFDFEPILKLFLATNHKPQVRGTDEGIWRRIRLIPFTVFIPPHERDKHLFDKLLSELSGILNWALEGLALWLEEGLGEPEEVMAATRQYRAEQDSLHDFLEACCVKDQQSRTKAKELYSRYSSWCEENGEAAESQKKFGQRLAERGLTKVKSSAVLWIGIRLRRENENLENHEWEEREDCDQKPGSELDSADHVPLIPKTLPHHPILPDKETGEGEHLHRLRVDMRVSTPRGEGIIDRVWTHQVAVNICRSGQWELFRTPLEISMVQALPGEGERYRQTRPD